MSLGEAPGDHIPQGRVEIAGDAERLLEDWLDWRMSSVPGSLGEVEEAMPFRSVGHAG